MKGKVFNYRNYKLYLRDKLAQREERGPRARLAEFIGCQLPYLSQVLNGPAHLSLEQAEGCNRFFLHGKLESSYFLNLVSYARAGTPELRSFYQDTLDEISRTENQVAKRLELNQELTDHDKARYYSSWEYAAVHMAVSLPQLQTRESIAEFLGLPDQRVSELLEFLVGLRLVLEQKRGMSLGPQRLHIGPESPYLKQHLTNWRVQAIRSLDRGRQDELHYSSIVSMAEEDIIHLREMMLETIDKIRSRVKDSREETLVSYGFDLFRINK